MADVKLVIGPDVPLVTRENVHEVLAHDPFLADAVARELEPGGYFDPPPPAMFIVQGAGGEPGTADGPGRSGFVRITFLRSGDK